MPKPPTLEQLQAAVDNWNATNPIGTPVRRYALMHPRSELTHTTTTRSLAWIMGGHSPMVMIVGFSGGVHLDSVEVIPEAEREKSVIPPAESLPPAKEKRSAAFFVSDIGSAVESVYAFADAFNDGEEFVKAVITELQRPRQKD